jgi:hypothetical protein
MARVVARTSGTVKVMAFRYIEPMFGFAADQTHVCVPVGAESALEAMVQDLLGTEDLIAVYIPEGTQDFYRANAMRGRVVGAVRLVDMPPGKTVRHYFYKDWDGTLRWPVGWPCKVVYAPPVAECPVLRTLVDKLHGANSFQPYVSRFQRGPFKLDPAMASELAGRFTRFPKVP